MLSAIARYRTRRAAGLCKHACWFVVCAAFSGCTILDPHVPAPEIEIPDAYIKRNPNSPNPAASPYDFAAFKSKYLTQLITLGRGFNFDIAAAIARIQEAEAQVRIATQPLIPTLQAQGTGSINAQHLNGQFMRTTTVTSQLTASYIVDLWGQ